MRGGCGGNAVKNSGYAKIIVVLKIEEMRYAVIGLLHDLVRSFCYLYLPREAIIWLEKILDLHFSGI